MFEIIGLFLGAAVFFGFSAVLGAIFGLAAWVLFRRRSGLFRRVWLAASIPPLCAVYMAFCLVVFPGESLFGDISEPLPNGYVLKALGKMPEDGEINGPSIRDQPQLAGYIGKVDLEGSTLFGMYSHLFTEQGFDPHPVLRPCCFAFDTRLAATQNFDSMSEMENSARKKLTLVEVQYFQSKELAHIRLVYLQRLIFSLPPCVLVLGGWLFLFLWRRDWPGAKTM
jgi:hypothetical protein